MIDILVYVSCKSEMYILKIAEVISENVRIAFLYALSIYPLYTPFLYSKTGVYRGIHFFLFFVLKHRSWVLVKTASVKK